MLAYLDVCCGGTRAVFTHCESHFTHHLKEIKLGFFPSFISGNVFNNLYWKDWNVTFLSNRIATIEGGGSPVCWETGGSWFKSRCGIFVKFHLWSAVSHFLYQDWPAGGVLLCLYLMFFQETRKKFTSEASRQKVKRVLVHPGFPVAFPPVLLAAIFSQISFRSVIVFIQSVCYLTLRKSHWIKMFISNAVYSLGVFVWGFSTSFR